MDTKIADVSLKKILKLVSKTDSSGFNPIPDLEKSLKLNRDRAEKIYYHLKQNGYIQHIGDLSPLYSKTDKVVSVLNTMKQWYEKPMGIIIITIIGGIILALLLNQMGLNSNEIKNYIILKIFT